MSSNCLQSADIYPSKKNYRILFGSTYKTAPASKCFARPIVFRFTKFGPQVGRTDVRPRLITLLECSKYTVRENCLSLYDAPWIISTCNMELDLQSLFGLLSTAVLIVLFVLPPRIWAHM